MDRRGAGWAVTVAVGAAVFLMLIPTGAGGGDPTASIPASPPGGSAMLSPSAEASAYASHVPLPASRSPSPAPDPHGGSRHHPAPIYFPPAEKMLGPPGARFTPIPEVVNPTYYYSTEPAPMGEADFGLTATGTGYTYSTPRFLGTAQIRSWSSTTCSTCGAGGGNVSIQLNVVLVLSDKGVTQDYWIQDVPFYNTTSGYFDVVDNIWNMSGWDLSYGSVSGNGSIYSTGMYGQNFYEDDANGQYNGTNIDLSLPVNISAEVVASTISGITQVGFLFNDGYGWQTYDNVSFPWSSGWTDKGFVVDGTQYNEEGYLNDAEWIIGGPGDRSTTQTQKANLTFGLDYWNGHNFKAVSNAYNFGTDTGETVSHIQEGSLSGKNPGAPGAAISYGSGSLGRLYVQSSLATLDITPNTATGAFQIQGIETPFVGRDVNLTLLPGTYRAEELNGSLVSAAANVTLTAGHYLHVTLPTVSVSPAKAMAGTKVNATGHSFAPSVSLSVTLPSWNLTLCNATTSASGGFSCSFTVPQVAAGRYEVAGTDASKASTLGTASFLVTTNLHLGVDASPSSTDVGIPFDLTANATGGFAPYRLYEWTFGDGTIASTTTPTTSHSYDVAGSYQAAVEVTDHVGSVVTTTVELRVNDRPTISNLTASALSADVGQHVTFTAGANLGTPPYTSFQWLDLPDGCPSSNTSKLTCTFVTNGTVRLKVMVTDSLGESSSGVAVFPYTIWSDPTVTAPAASPSNIDVGQTVRFQTSMVSGSGSPTFTWYGLPAGCSGDTPIVGCIPDNPGVYDVAVAATDSNGWTANRTSLLAFTVNSHPELPTAPTLSSPSADVGEALRISAPATGGSGGFTYVWKGLPVGCAPVNASTVSCTPTIARVYEVNLNATDSNQVSAGLSFAYAVVSGLRVSGPRAVVDVTDVGGTLTVNATATGGARGYEFDWSGLPTGCASAGASVACTPTAAGRFPVNVTITDMNGASVSGKALQLVVNARPTASLDAAPGGCSSVSRSPSRRSPPAEPPATRTPGAASLRAVTRPTPRSCNASRAPRGLPRSPSIWSTRPGRSPTRRSRCGSRRRSWGCPRSRGTPSWVRSR